MADARNPKPVKNNGTYIFSDFSVGLYYLDTPRSLGEQLASLALVGGRNVWAEKGALVAQYGYLNKGQIESPDRIVAITKDSQSASTFFIVTLLGKVYLYTAAQGLKQYKSSFETMSSNPIVARRGSDLIINTEGQTYLFGSYYDDSSVVAIDENVEVADFTSYYEFTVPLTSLVYYWNGKHLCVNNEDHVTVTSVVVDEENEEVTIRAVSVGEHKLYSENVTLSEKCVFPISLTYQPEDTGVGSRTITPVLMEVCINRLFIVDVSGNIFYSQIGVLNNFNEADGAGYFGGFYNDVSRTLDLEDFLQGCLICKENGIYHLTIGDTVNIQKLAQVGQQYASDHVIIREKVYCYDSNSGQIVIAAQQNVFGSLVAGKTIVSAEYLNAQDSGIANTKRFLVYNAEQEVLILYYGEQLNEGIVLTSVGTLFPRQLDKPMDFYIGFNQGVVGISASGDILEDFKKGTIVPNLSAIADFEAIGVRDNRIISSGILEITELNGIDYTVTTTNATTSYQIIKPPSMRGIEDTMLPPLLYSDYKNNNIYDSYSLTSKWAAKTSNVTRVYAPMSGRSGVSLTIEFPENVAFCLAALRLPDFSQGE